jgi:hypothetical protein
MGSSKCLFMERIPFALPNKFENYAVAFEEENLWNITFGE